MLPVLVQLLNLGVKMDVNLYNKFLNLSLPILITGETGTGKSKLAKNLFDQSHIFKEKFLTVHLASLKNELIESELFGHCKGAFTGAYDQKIGYLQAVGKGTLFLDEIGELEMETQKKLLYLLEEGKFAPVGGTQSLEFKGRIIMATHRNLKQMVKDGLFREDLYFRIKSYELRLPRLSNKTSDLKVLIFEVFNDLKIKHEKMNLVLDQNLIEKLVQHRWRGNIRELKGTLECAVVMADSNYISDIELESGEFDSDNDKSKQSKILMDQLPDNYRDALDIFERYYLRKKLIEYGGHVTLTAKNLGISKTTLIYKTKKYQIDTLRVKLEAKDQGVSRLADNAA